MFSERAGILKRRIEWRCFPALHGPLVGKYLRSRAMMYAYMRVVSFATLTRDRPKW
jgi:hypothetical protein